MGSVIKGRLFAKSEPTEEKIEEVEFKIHRFTPRIKPTDKRNIVVFSCFSEFGTEILGSMYCIPAILRRTKGKYTIVMGWQGRAFLYKHLVDEFWEIDEKHMWLRQYCRAFHHNSVNISRIEEQAKEIGQFISPADLGIEAVHPTLKVCKKCNGVIVQTEDGQQCESCKVFYHLPGFFENILESKKKVVFPIVSKEKCEAMGKYLKPNSVGITARNRSCYGRNLPPTFYEKLICQLEEMGYNPVWLGEKTSIHPCPFDRIMDFSGLNDLECTLGLVSHLKFTIQFWTASTRLAGLVGTPFIIFESPDQIYGGTGSPGHEGYRINLCTKGNKKIVLCHYNDIASSHECAFRLIKEAVSDVEVGNYEDIFGMEDSDYWRKRVISRHE